VAKNIGSRLGANYSMVNSPGENSAVTEQIAIRSAFWRRLLINYLVHFSTSVVSLTT
jgi:hypothetical protein